MNLKLMFDLLTQASQFNTEGLILSLVPGDIGKPTARSEKAIVNDGHCRWDIPVYETVRFLKDVKTGKVNQRIYHLIVSTTVRPNKIRYLRDFDSKIWLFYLCFVCRGLQEVVWLEKHQLILLIMLMQLKLAMFLFHYRTQVLKLCCMLASLFFFFVFLFINVYL